MRIYNEDEDKALSNISIFLTHDEGYQLISYLEELLKDPSYHHAHLSSNDYQKEITFCIYDDKNLDSFDPRTRKLIVDDE